MPATYCEIIERKRKNQKIKRQMDREKKISDLGGQAIHIENEPLCKKKSSERSRYLFSLKNPNYRKNIYRPREGASTEEEYCVKMVNGARSRTNGTHTPFNITPEDIEIPTHCPITGSEILLDYSNREQSPSLDRLIPELGYVKENVKVISNRANRIKSDATLEELENLVNYLKMTVNHIKS